jgi:peroxiredoxin
VVFSYSHSERKLKRLVQATIKYVRSIRDAVGCAVRNKQAIVLAWFPKAYTRGCTLECKSPSEHGDMIKRYDVAYFMISVDPLDQNTAFADQQHADFPLLSDPTKRTAA